MIKSEEIQMKNIGYMLDMHVYPNVTYNFNLIRLTGLLGVIVLCTIVWPAFLS